MRRVVFLLAVLLAGVASQATGQASARVEVTLDTVSNNPKVRILNLMEEERWREALDDAFRISLHWRVELWKRGGGFLGIVPANAKTLEFTMVIRREPLLGQYFITYFPGSQVQEERQYRSFDEFVLHLERAIDINKMAPHTEGSWYYVANLQVTALDEDQFLEMQRFLGAPGGAIARGELSNFLLRSVGLPSETLPDARSPRFRVP